VLVTSVRDHPEAQQLSLLVVLRGYGDGRKFPDLTAAGSGRRVMVLDLASGLRLQPLLGHAATHQIKPDQAPRQVTEPA
jgi:hypothetical protein